MAPHCLRLATAPPEILNWLRLRHSGVRIVSRRGGSVELCARDAPAAERLARSLADRLFVASTHTGARLTAHSVHALPGRVRFAVSGVSADRIESLARWLQDRRGVDRANASPASSSIVVSFDPTQTSSAMLQQQLLASDPSCWPQLDQSKPGLARAVASTGVLLAATAFGASLPAPVLGTAVALTGLPSLARALEAARQRRLGVDALDVSALVLSIATERLATGAFITWLLSIGDLLLEKTQTRARRAIAGRLDLEATDAHRLRAGRIEHVSARVLEPGDRIVIDAGARVAADGVVIAGSAVIDEKALTGESMPRTRHPGERVLSASVVVEGQVVVRVERVGSNTAARKIAEVLSSAGTKPMTLQRNSERVADRVVLPTFLLAAAAGAWSGEISRATSILITDFGTGLRIAVPMAALATMISSTRSGILIKGGQFIERLSQVDTVVFDKTGTLTCGQPQLLGVELLGKTPRADCLALAAAAEARQNHPIAHAIRQAAERTGLALPVAKVGSQRVAIGRGVSALVEGISVLVGSARTMREHGVDISAAARAVERHTARGASSVYVALNGQPSAVLAVADPPRPESRAVVQSLRAGRRRRQVLLLSGDTVSVARAVGAALGVDQARGELLPADKVNVVRELMRAGRTVAMIGDGLNDAPALTVADVGISIDGGTDVALEAADVLLLDGGLAKLPAAFELADRGMQTVRRGVAMVLVPNLAAIVLGALGALPPGWAALINNGSTIAAALAGLQPLLGRESSADRGTARA